MRYLRGLGMLCFCVAVLLVFGGPLLVPATILAQGGTRCIDDGCRPGGGGNSGTDARTCNARIRECEVSCYRRNSTTNMQQQCVNQYCQRNRLC